MFSWVEPSLCEHAFVTSQGSPLTRLRRALAGGDLLAACTAAADLRHVDLDEAAALLALIAAKDPEKLDAAAVRFLGRACLERSFITLSVRTALGGMPGAARPGGRGVASELRRGAARCIGSD